MLARVRARASVCVVRVRAPARKCARAGVLMGACVRVRASARARARARAGALVCVRVRAGALVCVCACARVCVRVRARLDVPLKPAVDEVVVGLVARVDPGVKHRCKAQV